MKLFFYQLLVLSLFFSSSLCAQIRTLDFSDGKHSFSVFEEGGVELKPFEGISYLRIISSGTYKIILPGRVEYIVEIDRGEIRSGLGKEGYATTIKLITDRLSLEAAKKLSYAFHKYFQLQTDSLDEWFEKLEVGEAYSAYGNGGLSSNFPFLAMSLRTTFGKEQPAFAIFSISWDEKFSRRSGRTLENNKELNVVYDMPKLLEGVPEFTEVEEVEPVIVKVNNPQSIVAQASKPEPATEESADVKTVGIPEQPAEKPSRWWLWVLGSLIMIGGIVWMRQRNSNDSSG